MAETFAVAVDAGHALDALYLGVDALCHGLSHTGGGVDDALPMALGHPRRTASTARPKCRAMWMDELRLRI